jgi:hypothetical protein
MIDISNFTAMTRAPRAILQTSNASGEMMENTTLMRAWLEVLQDTGMYTWF